MGNIGIVETPYGNISLSDTKWRETWSFWPRKCIFTSERIAPFTKIMHGKRFVCSSLGHDPQGKIVHEYYWATSKALVIHILKGKT